MAIRNGQDLILSLDGKPLGYSTSCKISDKAETSELATKENDAGLFTEKVVDKVGEDISADGFDTTDSRVSYATLKELCLTGKSVKANYSYVGDSGSGYEGMFIITSVELDATAGSKSKYSIQLTNSGKIQKCTINQTRKTTTASSQSDIVSET